MFRYLLLKKTWLFRIRSFVCFNSTLSTTLRDRETTKQEGFTDTFGRQHTYLRVSVTEKCNFRCLYCMPEEGVQLSPSENILSKNEIIRLLQLFSHYGVDKVRFTGGEPLVRKDFLDIVQSTKQQTNISRLAITTNGMILNKYLESLKESGVSGLNISLDTLIPVKFEFITRRRGHKTVLDSIFKAVELGFPSVKINCVVIRGFNDDEILSFCYLTKDWNITVRFIEYMPFEGNRWNTGKFVSFEEMKQKIALEFGTLKPEQNGIHDTTKHFRIPGFVGRIGFITSMSEHFCAGCNRLRITADGNLRVCLFGDKEVSLRDYMRQGASDDELAEIVAFAVKRKDFALGGYEDMTGIASNPNRPMIHIGG
ncbi:Cyclic pyranopterin monophosphate synthase, mitochondrial [Galdieria sulphuraria]|nr:Cyclic pyranopterin monophosphate synthase, mitochondrial [Galdieria sulphuraria]